MSAHDLRWSNRSSVPESKDNKRSECCTIDPHDYACDLSSRFYKVITVGAVVNDSTKVYNDLVNGIWTGPAVELFEKVIARVVCIKKVKIVEYQTAEEALFALNEGKISTIITPLPITQEALLDNAYLAVSTQTTTQNLISWINPASVAPSRGCSPGSLVNNLNTTNGNLSFDQVVQLVTNTTVNPYLLIVNDLALIQRLLDAGIDPEYILYVPFYPQTAEEIQTLILDYVIRIGLSLCSIAFFGTYPVDCPASLNGITFTQVLPSTQNILYGRLVDLPADLVVQGYGWPIAKYAVDLQFALSFALDQVVKSGEYSCIVKNAFIPNTTCPLFTAPPKLYSYCRRFIPAVNVQELFLPDKLDCVNHEVEVDVVKADVSV